VTLAKAQLDLDGVAGRLARAYPDTNRGKAVSLEPARSFDGGLRKPVSAFLAVVMALVGIVLLTACINLAGLQLVRAAGRRREMAVRLALGASRARLIRQLLTESGLLALLGGALGLLFAIWTSRLLTGFNPLPATIPIRLDLQPDVRLYAFTLALAGVCGVLLGLAPALACSSAQVTDGLKEQAANLAARSRLRGLFVAAQLALSLLLAIAAALFLRSLWNARAIDVGFEPRHALALDLDVKSKGWSEARARRYFHEALERVRALPGVRSAAFANLAPLDLATPRVDARIDGLEPPAGQDGLPLSFNRVSPRYFETLGVPLAAGRDFDEQDDAGRPAVAIVNQTLARRFWPAQDALGRRFRVLRGRGLTVEQMTGGADVQVVGVARDVKYRSLGEDPEPHVYLPYLQHFDSSRTLIVATRGDAPATITTVQRELLAMEPDLPGFFARTLEQHAGLALVPARMAALLSTLFGGLALSLAALGVYGVVSHSVAERTREIGIRRALGASAGDVSRLVLGGGARLIGAGLAAGLLLALALARFVGALLYDVSATEPALLLGVSLLLALVALGASWIPARRALRVDPLVALRHE
jgi:predicted permease